MNVVFNLVKETLGGNINCQSDKGSGTRFMIGMPDVR